MFEQAKQTPIASKQTQSPKFKSITQKEMKSPQTIYLISFNYSVYLWGDFYLLFGLRIFQPSSSPPAQALAWALAYLTDLLT